MKFNYKAFYEKIEAYFNARPIAKQALPWLDRILTYIFFLSYPVYFLYSALIDKVGVKDQLCMLFVPALGLLVVSVLRLAIQKPRPYAEDGDNITPLIPKKQAGKNSFPSRHVTCAVVISMTVLAHFVELGAILMLFSFILAGIRLIGGLHYPSDLIAGGVIGFAVGALAFVL